jgi:Protein of unknown function (DUF3108)
MTTVILPVVPLRVTMRLAVLCAIVALGLDFPAALQLGAQTRITQAASGQSSPSKPVLAGFPFTNESLSYTVNWPSGLTLGDAHLSATGTSTGWRFELSLDAGFSAFAVKDTYRSTASADLCSETFSKDLSHGSRKGNETVTIDKAASTATRTPANGLGSSTTPVPDCIHDALTFLFYARRELGQGRVPTAQEVIFGATYNASLQYAGAETIQVGEKRVLTDKVVCHIRGQASDIQFDAYFDRDAARTPLSVRVPLPIGKFSLEIVR